MFQKTRDILQRLLNRYAHSKHMKLWLSFVSFADASFSPIPPDIFLVPALMVEKTREKWLQLSSLVAGSSVLGGVFGYFIGFVFFALFGEKIVDFYGLQEEIIQISEVFSRNAFWAVFTGAFTPLPYKVFTISAGLFKINFVVFLLASISGRFIRYLILGYIMKLFGEDMTRLIFKYFKTATLVIVVLVLLVFFV